jgi:hypothetical protein
MSGDDPTTATTLKADNTRNSAKQGYMKYTIRQIGDRTTSNITLTNNDMEQNLLYVTVKATTELKIYKSVFFGKREDTGNNNY